MVQVALTNARIARACADGQTRGNDAEHLPEHCAFCAKQKLGPFVVKHRQERYAFLPGQSKCAAFATLTRAPLLSHANLRLGGCRP